MNWLLANHPIFKNIKDGHNVFEAITQGFGIGKWPSSEENYYIDVVMGSKIGCNENTLTVRKNIFLKYINDFVDIYEYITDLTNNNKLFITVNKLGQPIWEKEISTSLGFIALVFS